MKIVVVIFSIVFFVTIVRGIERVERESTVLVAVTTGTDPMGRIVEVIVTVTVALVTENDAIFRAVK